MKPEPLKDKLLETENEDFKSWYGFNKKDIKSAVRYLKEEIGKIDMVADTTKERELIYWEVIRKIEESFEDVTRKEE